MKERPILFSAPMVRAILTGMKTQTRRVVKNCHIITCDDRRGASDDACPFGVPGDRLWVRETARVASVTTGRKPWYTVEYKAGGPDLVRYEEMPGRWFPRKAHNVLGERLWCPAIHTPRWASRLTLEIVNVRVERLQAISAADAVAEGWPQAGDVERGCDGPDSGPFQGTTRGDWVASGVGSPDDAVEWYADLWDEINGEGSWDANPWVWVVEFGVVKPGTAGGS